MLPDGWPYYSDYDDWDGRMWWWCEFCGHFHLENQLCFEYFLAKYKIGGEK